MSRGVLRFRKRVVEADCVDWGTKQIDVLDPWYEVSIDGSWTACFRLAVQNHRPVVSELRIFPTEDRDLPDMDYLPGEWSADEYGPDVEVPLRGVTAGVVRAVPFESLSAVPDVIEWIRRERPRDLERLAGSALTKEDVQRRRPGPKGPSDEYLVEYAEEYHALVAQGKPNPHTILARTCDLSHERSKHLMSMARDRGLAISPSTEDGRGGRAGGSLTPKGEAILQQMKKNRRRKTQ